MSQETREKRHPTIFKQPNSYKISSLANESSRSDAVSALDSCLITHISMTCEASRA